MSACFLFIQERSVRVGNLLPDFPFRRENKMHKHKNKARAVLTVHFTLALFLWVC
jgi:hypothetical protein